MGSEGTCLPNNSYALESCCFAEPGGRVWSFTIKFFKSQSKRSRRCMGGGKLNYLFSTPEFSQFLICSRLLPNHECFPPPTAPPPPPLGKPVYFFNDTHFFLQYTSSSELSKNQTLESWLFFFFFVFHSAQKLSLLAFLLQY